LTNKLVLALLAGFFLGSLLLCTVGSARRVVDVGEVAADLGSLDASGYLEGVDSRLARLEAERGQDGHLGLMDWIYILTAIGGGQAGLNAYRNRTRRAALGGQDQLEVPRRR
jgi:hypothetical protein